MHNNVTYISNKYKKYNKKYEEVMIRIKNKQYIIQKYKRNFKK